MVQWRLKSENKAMLSAEKDRSAARVQVEILEPSRLRGTNYPWVMLVFLVTYHRDRIWSLLFISYSFALRVFIIAQNDSFSASCINRGLLTVEFTEPNPAAVTSLMGMPN